MSTPVTPETQAADAKAAQDTRRHLDRSLMHGVAWTGAIKWGTQLFSWAATLIIARLLTPEDYGILVMANVYLGFVSLVNEFGLGPAIIRQRDLTEEQISAIGGVSVGLSLALMALSALVSGPISAFYEEKAVQWVIIALSVTFLTSGLRVLPRALLTRDLRFKRVAAIDAVESISSMVITLVLAALGFRYWSLVLGGVLSSAIATVAAISWRPHRRHWPANIGDVKESLVFGWHIVVSRFAWYLYSNADFAVVGRMFGKTNAGGYGFAWTLASIPVTRISALVNQVTPAIFSAVQDNKEQLGRYFLRLSEGLALVTLPFSVGVALVAREFVLVALGPEWRPAIIPLQLLAFYAGFRSITTLHPQILAAVGRSREQMRYSLLALAIMPPLFYLGGKLGGMSGVAWAWIVGYPLVMIPPYRAVLDITGLSLGKYLAALWPSILGSSAMAAAVLGVASILPHGMAPVELLIVKSVLGAAVYAAMVFGLQRDRLRVLREMVRQLKR